MRLLQTLKIIALVGLTTTRASTLANDAHFAAARAGACHATYASAAGQLSRQRGPLKNTGDSNVSITCPVVRDDSLAGDVWLGITVAQARNQRDARANSVECRFESANGLARKTVTKRIATTHERPTTLSAHFAAHELHSAEALNITCDLPAGAEALSISRVEAGNIEDDARGAGTM